MNTYRLFLHGTTVAAFAAAAFIIDTDAANAQQAGAEQTGEVIEEIVEVEAPVVRHRITREGPLGLRFETVEISRPVSYADLDLRKHADVNVLRTRIKATARESCEELSDMFPLKRSGPIEISRCTKRAVAGTEDELRAAIAAAS